MADLKGRVLRVSGLQSLVEADGSQWQCEIRGRLKAGQRETTSAVVTGDWVEFTRTTSDSGIIDSIDPRHSKISRAASGSRPYEQILAVNVDLFVVVVAARRPRIGPGFIDRALVTAQLGNLEPVICINKIDLDPERRCGKLASIYADLGYRVLLTSAVTGEAVAELKDMFDGRVSALVGQSGVGKSSILNCIDPGLEIATDALMKTHDRGRHTTAAVQLHRLTSGGYVADTPGIKQLRPWGVDRSTLVSYFVEMAPLVEHCRFRDCTHAEEPDCAIREAVQQGKVASTRYDGFKRMEATLFTETAT